MASALFLVSWAVMMGPMVYGTSLPPPASPSCTLPWPPVDFRTGAGSYSGSVLISVPLARHLISAERLPFTATYFGSIGLTLYFALGVSTPPPSHPPRDPSPPPFQPVLHRKLPHLPPLPRHSTNATPVTTAPKHPAHPHILDRANGSTGLVPRFVLPHGVDGVAICSQFRHEPGNGLDEWMRNTRRECRVCCCGVDCTKL